MTLNRSTPRFTVLLALLLVLALPWAASAQSAGPAGGAPSGDPSDPDFLLTLLEDGVAVEGVFEGDVTAQLYGFFGSEGDVVTVEMLQADDSGLDPFIVLLGPAGQVIGSDDDSGPQPLSSLIDGVELPVSGSYFILASTYTYIDNVLEESDAALAEAQPYTLTVSGFTEPENPEDRLFFSGDLELGATSEGYSTLEEPVYYYTFIVAEDAAPVTVDLSVSSLDFDTLAMVFGPGGTRLAVNSDDPEGIGTDSAIRGLELTEPGKYLFFATDVFFYNAGVGGAMLEYTGGDFTIILSDAK